MITRRSLVRSGLTAMAAAPFSRYLDVLGKPSQDGEIVLGVSAAFSGPSRALGTELYRGSMAYFSHVNENGGVNGRRITLKLLDDGYQPEPCVANTLSLLQDDSVFLLFGYVGTPTVTRALPLLKRFRDRGVFLFFPFTGAEPQREPPYGEFAFNLRASYRQETAGLVDSFVRHGLRRIAVFYQNDAYGRSGWAGVRAALSRYGGTIVGEATYRRGSRFSTGMRSQVEILRSSNPDAVICVGAYAACAALARDAVDLGLRVPVANLSFVGSENLLELLQGGGGDPSEYSRFLVNSQVVPSYEDRALPAVREYHEMMDLYDPPPPEVERITEGEPYTPFARSFVSLEGFLNARMIIEILRLMGDDLDRSRLEEAVFAVNDYDLGVGEQVSFGAERRQGLQGIYYTVVDGDRFVPLEDWESKVAEWTALREDPAGAPSDVEGQ